MSSSCAPTVSDIIQKLKLSGALATSDFTFGPVLGTGSYSTVSLVTLACDPRKTPFALKEISKRRVIDTNVLRHLRSEKMIANQLDSELLTKCYATFQNEHSIFFLLEFVQGGELWKLVDAMNKLPHNWVQFYVFEVASALAFLHAKGIIYRDLKPENVLLTANGHVKLTDFGFAKTMNELRTFTICGTAEYLAPEIILAKKSGYSFEADFWALGVFTCELATGFANQTHAVRRQRSNQNVRPDFEDQVQTAQGNPGYHQKLHKSVVFPRTKQKTRRTKSFVKRPRDRCLITFS